MSVGPTSQPEEIEMSDEKKIETPDENEAPEVVAHSAEDEGEELPWCIMNSTK